MRGVIPRSFEYIFSLINREVERVNIMSSKNILLLQTLKSRRYNLYNNNNSISHFLLHLLIFCLVLVWEVQELPLQVFLHRDLQRADLRPAGQRVRQPVPQGEHQKGRVCRRSRGEDCHLRCRGLSGRNPETHVRLYRKRREISPPHPLSCRCHAASSSGAVHGLA